jgi:thymidylate synthase ThyX
MPHKVFIDRGYISAEQENVDPIQGIYKKVFVFEVNMPMFIATQLTTLKNYEPTREFVNPNNKKAFLSIIDALETYRLMIEQGVHDKTARMVVPPATYIKFTLRMSLSEIKSLYKRVNPDTCEYIRVLNNIAINNAPHMCKLLKIYPIE